MDIRNFIPFGQVPDQLQPGDDAITPPLEQMGRGYDQTIAPLLGRGLGLARQGLDAVTPSANALNSIFLALEAGGAAGQGRTPLYIQQQQAQQENALRRQQLSQQLQAQTEQKRQHDLQLIEKIMSGPQPAAVKQKMLEGIQGPLASQAMALSRSMKDADFDSFEAYKSLIPDDVQQRFVDGSLPAAELSEWVNMAREQHKVNIKEQVKSKTLEAALNTPAESRSAFQRQLVEEHEAATELKRADIDLKKAQTLKAQREATQGPPDHSVLNRVHQQLSGGKSYEQGTPETQAQALQKYSQMNAEGRTAVQLATPAPVEKRSNLIKRSEFLKTGALVQPPAGASEGSLRSGDYIEITDKQKEAWGEVVNSGTTLTALFDMVDPLITAKTSGQALKQYAQLSVGAVSKKNPAAATYLADSEAFSSRMARVFGSEVGVLTQGDVERWKRALPTFGDTVGVKDAKKKVFMDIYNQSRAMAIKKLAGEDISADQDKLRKGPLAQIDKVAPTTVDEDFDLLMGGKK